MPKFIFVLLLLKCLIYPSYGQEVRIRDKNQIGWISYFGTFRVGEKLSIHTEYQYRRTNWLADPQQHLLRAGINYSKNPSLVWLLGYGFIKTYPYGDYPIASAGIPFPEHRSYQQLILRQSAQKTNFLHRFRLEQRWLGRPDTANHGKISSWTYLNRFRYLFRVQHPLNMIIPSGKMYAAVYDEIFIGFGENIGANVFDQNRLGILLGYSINDKLTLEAGYLNQILQQGSRVDSKPVFQHNSGFQINTVINLNLQ